MEFDRILIGVEVKFLSGESGANQLDREANILQRKAGDRDKLLILLAPESTCLDVVTPARQQMILDRYGVKLGSVAWEDIFDELKNFQSATNLE